MAQTSFLGLLSGIASRMTQRNLPSFARSLTVTSDFGTQPPCVTGFPKAETEEPNAEVIVGLTRIIKLTAPLPENETGINPRALHLLRTRGVLPCDERLPQGEEVRYATYQIERNLRPENGERQRSVLLDRLGRSVVFGMDLPQPPLLVGARTEVHDLPLVNVWEFLKELDAKIQRPGKNGIFFHLDDLEYQFRNAFWQLTLREVLYLKDLLIAMFRRHSQFPSELYDRVASDELNDSTILFPVAFKLFRNQIILTRLMLIALSINSKERSAALLERAWLFWKEGEVERFLNESDDQHSFNPRMWMLMLLDQLHQPMPRELLNKVLEVDFDPKTKRLLPEDSKATILELLKKQRSDLFFGTGNPVNPEVYHLLREWFSDLEKNS